MSMNVDDPTTRYLLRSACIAQLCLTSMVAGFFFGNVLTRSIAPYLKDTGRESMLVNTRQ